MIPKPPYPVERGVHALPMFSPEQCAVFAKQVLDARDLWTDRGLFDTLGATTYQDAVDQYPAIADHMNEALWERFAVLYLETYRQLADVLKMGVCPHPQGVGYMGFHVFDSRVGDTCGHPHVDEPHDRIAWPFEWAHPFSFTLPLALPEGGGGMDMWPELTDSQLDAYMAEGELPEHEHLAYQVGVLYLHTGAVPHRIANPCPIEEGEFRITLQGHGVVTADGFVLYF